MAAHGDYIRQETLSDAIISLTPGAAGPDDAARSETAKVEGMEVTLAVSRAAAGQSG